MCMYILICEFRPIQSVNKTQCMVHFWSSEVQLQNKSDFRLQSTHVLLTTWTSPSTAPEMADLFQRIVVPFCTHLPSWEWTIWRPLSGMTRAQTGHVSCHQKLLPLLLRSPAEHCGGHPVHYMQLYVDMHDAFHRVRGLHVWNHAIYCCCWCGYALWQMHTVGWEDCVCPFFLFFYLFIILPLVHTHRLRRIVTISVRWMLLCKEVIIAEDSPYVTMQHMTF